MSQVQECILSALSSHVAACDAPTVGLQAMIVLLTMLTRTSVVDATHVWEQLARQNASAP